jgi:hypothetical protein
MEPGIYFVLDKRDDEVKERQQAFKRIISISTPRRAPRAILLTATSTSLASTATITTAPGNVKTDLVPMKF